MSNDTGLAVNYNFMALTYTQQLIILNSYISYFTEVVQVCYENLKMSFADWQKLVTPNACCNQNATINCEQLFLVLSK